MSLVLIVSSVKYQSFRYFLRKDGSFYTFSFGSLNLPAFGNKQKNTQHMTVSMEMVRMAKSHQERNQSERSDLPQNNIIILINKISIGNHMNASAFRDLWARVMF